MAAILRIKNPETGEFEDIKALVGPKGDAGPQGPKGDTPPLSNIAPSSLGTASPGTATNASREDHVHPMPTANDIGALPVDGTAEDSSKLNGQEASYYATEKEVSQLKDDISDAWSAGHTYAAGEYAIYNGSLWRCLVANTGVTPAEGNNWTKCSIASELRPVKTAAIYNSAVNSIKVNSVIKLLGFLNVSFYGKINLSDTGNYNLIGNVGYNLSNEHAFPIYIYNTAFELKIETNGDINLVNWSTWGSGSSFYFNIMIPID